MDTRDTDGENQEMWAQLMAPPAAKLIEAQKRAERFAEGKEVHKACKELMQCTVLTRIIYGNQHWRLAEALANLAYGYLTLQGLPCQATHHANSAKYILLSLRGDTPPASSEEKGTVLSIFVTIYYTLGMANLMQKDAKECYCNLQKADKCLEELQELVWKGAANLKVCNKDIIVALGRASLQKNELDLASKYFEKAVDYLISAEGDAAPELIPLYQEIAKIKQMKKIYEKSISYALQAHSVSLALYQKFSPEVGSAALFLGKAYAATGEEKHIEAAEKYFNESLVAYKEALGMDHPQTINALKVFSKWLGLAGKRKQAYKLLKESFKTQQNPCNDFNKQAAERLYIMGCICLAEEKIRGAYQLLSKCVQIQIAIYGSHHKKTKKTQELLDMMDRLPTEQKLTKCLKQDKKATLIFSIPDL
ncbi:tetratricopeptide repeat protein 23-like [Pantherophis guttatus]|uniref:Tetratricopeptide repeat protein 23-like n=1 Tax=Pantherophis guttatus TaxID=94885 RepID=A0A6P9DRF5_PANGU|nr:tetratricopeptide repeat protein 23-like [Pantherophis guttatus]